MMKYSQIALAAFSLALIPSPMQVGQMSPTQVVQRYCEMDQQGKQLTEQGWTEMAALYSEPKPSRAAKVVVVKDFVVSRPEITGNRAELYAEYVYIGRIDSQSASFSRLPYLKVRSGFDLVRTDPSSQWKVAVSPPESHISVATGLRYLADLRDHATDVRAKKNAEIGINTLRRLISTQ